MQTLGDLNMSDTSNQGTDGFNLLNKSLLVAGLIALVALILGYESVDEAWPVFITVVFVYATSVILRFIQRVRQRKLPSNQTTATSEEHKADLPTSKEIQARLANALQRAIVDHKKLFGVDDLVDDIQEYLLSPESGWIISLFGEGGVGKTALAYEIVRQYGEQSGFARFAWVSAKQRYYSVTGELRNRENVQLQWVDLTRQIADQLGLELGYSRTEWLDDFRREIRQLPAGEKVLIVIDNLETIEDIGVVEYLDSARGLDGGIIKPHKVVITTRRSVIACSENVVEKEIKGLKPHSAYELIRFLSRGNRDVETAINEELKPILDITEGNPLLIKLVVNRFLVSHRPLGVILNELKEMDPQLKEFLYLQSFKELERAFDKDVPAQLMRSFCPSIGGELLTYGQLIRYSGITDEQIFRDALKLACDLSLIRVSGLDTRYSIHSLLWKFVCKEETDASC